MIPRPTVRELTIRYKYEDLDDLFVEGPSDKYLLLSLYELADKKRRIYTSEQVDFDGTQPVRNGHKGRLIYLGSVFEETNARSPTVLIDDDFDRYLGIEQASSYIVRTTYTSLPFHLFDLAHITLSLKAYYMMKISIAQVNSIVDDARFLFACRIYLMNNDPEYGLPSIERTLFENDGPIHKLNRKEIIGKIKACSHKLSSLTLKKIETIQSSFDDDLRKSSRYHDLVELCDILVGKIKKKHIADRYIRAVVAARAADKTALSEPFLKALICP